MPTIGIKSKVTLSTETSRSDVREFYKAIHADRVSQVLPARIDVNDELEVDLSNSSYFIFISDKYGIENEIFDLEFIDTLGSSFTIKQVSFCMFNASNLQKVTVKNTSLEYSSDVYLMY